MKNSKGFTLITVLILTSMATLVVLSSLRDTIIQERLSGNYQKQLNARLMAEKGVYASMQQLNQQLLDQPSQSLEDLVNQSTHINGTGGLDNTAFNADLTINKDGELVISSTGNRFEGEANLEAIFEFVQTPGKTGNSPFSPGITGCSGISLSGSGKIDSYDSSLGDYNASLSDGSQNISEHAFVQTLGGDSTIILSGNGKIFGDVIASNSIQLTGSADISGNVHSNGFLSLPNNSKIGGNVTAYLYYSQQSGSVGGSIQANGDITLKQTYVAGNVTSGANIDITGNIIDGKILSQSNTNLSQATVFGGVQSHGNYSQTGGTVNGVKVLGDVALTQWGSTISNDDLRYLGNGRFTGETPEYNHAPYKTSPPLVIEKITAVQKIDFAEGDVTSGTSSCDPLHINNAINDLDDPLNNYQDLYISGSGKGDHLLLHTSKAEFLVDNASTPDGDITAQSTRFLEKPTEIIYFDNISIKGHLTVKENHHATLFVQGDFTMDGASSLTIPANSSLTIIIQGKFNLGGGAQVYTPTNGLTAQGKPVFSIYSNYAGAGTGVSFSGGTEQVYAAIYAPNSHVEINSAVGFKGSVLGNTVNVSGAGGIHYDTALANTSVAGNNGSSGAASRLVFKGWRYAVQEDEN